MEYHEAHEPASEEGMPPDQVRYRRRIRRAAEAVIELRARRDKTNMPISQERVSRAEERFQRATEQPLRDLDAQLAY